MRRSYQSNCSLYSQDAFLYGVVSKLRTDTYSVLQR